MITYKYENFKSVANVLFVDVISIMASKFSAGAELLKY